MTRLESRPSRRGIWDYVFFIDIEGHQADANVAAALKEMEQKAEIKIVGAMYDMDTAVVSFYEH